MIFIGIDPGKSGALATIETLDAGNYAVNVLPFDEALYRERLRSFDGCKAVAVVERVGAMPKQGVTSMFNFGVNFGFIQGLLAACGIPFELVTPARWKKEFGVTADKNTSIEVAHRLFPDVDLRRTKLCRKPDDGVAEALLMAEFARRKMGGNEA